MINGSFKVDKNKWERGKVKAKKFNLSVSFIIRTLFDMWLNDEVKIEVEIKA